MGSFAVTNVSGFAFVSTKNAVLPSSFRSLCNTMAASHQLSLKSNKSPTSLAMVDNNVIMGAGIAVAGLAAGVGLVAFTEQQGERGKERGGGVSESMATRMEGMLMEDVEVSSVSDLGSLTTQLEQALSEAGGNDAEELKMSEEDKKRIAEEADDG